MDALGDCVAMKAARLEDAEDEHGEGAGRHSLFRPNGHRHNYVMPMPTVKSMFTRDRRRASGIGEIQTFPVLCLKPVTGDSVHRTGG